MPSLRLTAGAATVLAILVAAVFVSFRASRTTTPPNILVITLDTTRADRLSPYGLMDVSMPALERLAAEGVLFDQAWSVAPLTLPAHVSLFTGVIPPAHGVRYNNDRLATRHPTLAEMLKPHGLQTAAFLGSAVLNADRGLSRGFDTYREVGSEPTRQRRSDTVVDDAIGWFQQGRRSKFFVWVHIYDPHRPYDPPDQYRRRYFDPYIGEIAFADAQIGRLLDTLEGQNLLENAVVVVAGDHGESLGEHGERDHGIFVYESVLRVPLIIRGPGVVPGRTGTLVRLVDVMPTLLDLSGIDLPPMQGVSLVPLLKGAAGTLDLEAFAESQYPRQFGWSPLRTLRDGRFKVIEAPRPELYDLARDPFEQRNLYDTRRPLADVMIQRLRAIAPAESPAQKENDRPSAAAMREDLAALGYVGTPRHAHQPRPGTLPDPKDCMPEHDPSLRGLAGDGSSAIPARTASRRQRPDNGC